MALEELYTNGLMAIIMGMIFVFLILAIALYIYMGFAFMAIGKKAKLSSPGLAWIPGIGPAIIVFQISKMHWWPWLLIIGMLFGAVIPVIEVVCGILFAVFFIVWEWKMFEKVKRPGWWALLCLIPVVNLVLIGIAAWSKK